MQLPAINSSRAAPPSVLQATVRAPNKPASSDANITGSDNTSPTQDGQDTRQSGPAELSEADRRTIAELKKIDRDVRAHEAAHLGAAGGLARGGASFSYTQGPDGQRYAVGGEVSIDTSPEDNPESTILKAQRIQAAALAPAQPSSTDRAVAAGAAQMAASARAELLVERFADSSGEKASQVETTGNDGNVTGDKQETIPATGETTSSSDTRKPEPAADLYKLINQITSAEDTLGRLLNTAV